MLGTFSPQLEPYTYVTPEDTTPSGMFARGSYSARTKVRGCRTSLFQFSSSLQGCVASESFRLDLRVHKVWHLVLTVPRRRPEVLPGDQLHLRHPPGLAVDELIGLHWGPEQNTRFVSFRSVLLLFLCWLVLSCPVPRFRSPCCCVRLSVCVNIPSMCQLNGLLTPFVDGACQVGVPLCTCVGVLNFCQGLVFFKLPVEFRAMKLRFA
jgi:hypothetical protein